MVLDKVVFKVFPAANLNVQSSHPVDILVFSNVMMESMIVDSNSKKVACVILLPKPKNVQILKTGSANKYVTGSTLAKITDVRSNVALEETLNGSLITLHIIALCSVINYLSVVSIIVPKNATLENANLVMFY